MNADLPFPTGFVTAPTVHWVERGLRLTLRQQQVLALLAEGLSTKLIGRRLGISAATVKVHVSSVLRSLNVENRMQAVVTAQRMGLLAARPQGIEPSLVPAPVPR